MRIFSLGLFVLIMLGPLSAAVWAATCGSSDGSVKVFILAGQSNMVGTGVINPTNAQLDYNSGMGTLRYLVDDPAQSATYGHLINPDGSWAARSDAWLVDLDYSGPITVAGQNRIGPDLQFAHVVADQFADDVLIIKIAWGGKSLAVDFRPPGSGGAVGPYYLTMINRVHEVLGDLSAFMPGYAGQGYQIVGFGWHQGWNDRVNQAANDEYQFNLVNLINDLRDEFELPEMPFVLATTGMSGWDETHPRALSLMNAQLAAPDDSRLKHGKVKTVETRDFWRDREVSPSGQAYHWNNNAETYFLIGDAMGHAMTDLVCEQTDNTGTANNQYEAEAFTAAENVGVDAGHTGFTGSGYADFGGAGSWLEWNNVTADNADSRKLTFRYACGSSNRPSTLFVNGVEVADLAFSATGSWSSWQTESVTVPLRSGANKIRVVAQGNGGPNLDHVKLGGSLGFITLLIGALLTFRRLTITGNYSNLI